MKKRITNPRGREGDRVSFCPLNFDEAVSGLAQVKPPESNKKKPKAEPKKGKG
jgi:hypothetical protein